MISQLQFVFIAITVLLFLYILYMVITAGFRALEAYLVYRTTLRVHRLRRMQEEEYGGDSDEEDTDEPIEESAANASVMSRKSPFPAATAPIVNGSQRPGSEVTNGIAMRHNGHNQPVVHCEQVTMLARETGDDPDIVAAVILVLARLAVARHRDGQPVIGETALIKYGLQITPGGSNRRYELARAALKAEIARIQGRAVRDEVDDVLPDGSVVRRNELGQRYVIDRTTKQPVVIEE